MAKHESGGMVKHTGHHGAMHAKGKAGAGLKMGKAKGGHLLTTPAGDLKVGKKA